jgi:hypothetical protein
MTLVYLTDLSVIAAFEPQSLTNSLQRLRAYARNDISLSD